MPLYEYQCTECENKFELRRPMSAAQDEAECPQCHSRRVARQISRVIALTRDDAGSRALGGASACGCRAGGCGCGTHRN